MKRKLTLPLLALTTLFTPALAQTQHGVVKTRGRLGDNGTIIAGRRIPNAIVQVKGRTAVISQKNGAFSFPIPSKQFYLETVKKQGYTLVDPDLLSQQLDYSNAPLYIVMEEPEKQLEDKLEAMDKLNITLRSRLDKSRAELKRLKEQNNISSEDYQRRLQQIAQTQSDNQNLVTEMADKYSKIDFDQLDETNRRIKDCFLNGRLTEADSLLKSKGSLDERIDAWRQHVEADEKMESELKEKKAMRQKEADGIAQDCMNHFELCRLRNENDSAAYYIRYRVEKLDSTNVEWLLETGDFYKIYLAAYNEALLYYETALRHATARDGEESADAATCLLNIGEAYLYMGKMKEAKDSFDRSLAIRSKIFPADHITIADCYNNIGAWYQIMGDFSKIMDYHTKALEIRKAARGELYRYTALSYFNVGVSYSILGDYPKALEYNKKALDLQLKIFGEDHPEISKSYDCIGMIYDSMNKFALAEEYYQKAIDMKERVLGEMHPETAQSYLNLGSSYANQGKYADALAYMEKAMNVCKTLFDNKHTLAATCFNNMGCVYQKTGQHDKAIEAFRKAIEVTKLFYGENHPDIATIINNIGAVYGDQGEFAKSRESYLQSEKMLLAFFPEDDERLAPVNMNLGSNAVELGLNDEVMPRLQKALAIYRKVYGEEHASVAECYEKIGSALSVQGKYQESLAYNEKALAIYRKVLPNSHPDLAVVYNNIALNHLNLGEYDKAEEVFKQATDNIRKNFGEKSPKRVSCYNNLATLYTVQGKLEEAMKILDENIALAQASDYPDPNDLAKAYVKKTDILIRREQYDEAMAYTGKVFDICQRLHGQTPHISYISVFDQRGAICLKMGKYDEALEWYEKERQMIVQTLGEESSKMGTFYNNLGCVYQERGKKKTSRDYFRKALDIMVKYLPESHPSIKAVREKLELSK